MADESVSVIPIEEQVSYLFQQQLAKDEQSEQRKRSPNRDFNMNQRPGEFEMACAPTAPDWYRLAHLCYSEMDWNGHYPINRQQVMAFLGVKDVRNLRRSIKKAVEYRALAEGSDIRCLKAPAHMTTKSPNARREACLYDH